MICTNNNKIWSTWLVRFLVGVDDSLVRFLVSVSVRLRALEKYRSTSSSVIYIITITINNM